MIKQDRRPRKQQAETVYALQDAAEGYVVTLFCDTNRSFAHDTRIAVMPEEIRFAHCLGIAL